MKKNRKRQSDELNFWQSYSDMMAALLLIFILIMSQTLLQSLVNYEEKLAIQQEQMEEQEQTAAKLREQEIKLEEQQEQIDAIIGIRSNLIEKLSSEFENSEIKVIIDQQTGAIALDSNILFDTGKYELKTEGIQFLNEFLPIYLTVMLDEEFSEYISEIIIEGHTDTNGTYMYNMELSQKRAFEVAIYCLNADNNIIENDKIEQLEKIITANGRSESNPIMNDDNSVNMEASRRVEFKFRMKDDEMINQMKDIIEK